MLTFRVSDGLINLLQAQALEEDYLGDCDDGEILAARTLLGRFARRFNRFQETAGSRVIVDGLPHTIGHALGSEGDHSWPRREGRLLQSLWVNRLRGIPGQPGNYLCPMGIGPTPERSMGHIAAIMLYLHRDRCGSIAWIGAESDLDAGFAFIDSETGSFADFALLLRD